MSHAKLRAAFTMCCYWAAAQVMFVLQPGALAFVVMPPAQCSRTVHFASTESSSPKLRDRKKELQILADTMKVTVDELRPVLRKQRAKMSPDAPRAKYVDWLLAPTFDKSTSSSGEDSPRNLKSSVPRRPKKKVPTPTEETSPVSAAISPIVQATFQSKMTFAQLEDLHPMTKRALVNDMKLEYMTEIQARTYAPARSGQDVLARARTGTGKTIAFLAPSIERLVSDKNKIASKGIQMLIMSPTRELATQIGDQAQALIQHHGPNPMSVYVMYGGVKIGRDIRALEKTAPTILVATPGRLLDHMEGRSSGISARQRQSFLNLVKDTSIVVLDETDRLLDMGFRKDLHRILSFLPRKEKRQTLLFSATLPPALKADMAKIMTEEFVEVDCIQQDADNNEESTHAHVEQTHVILPSMDQHVSSVLQIIFKAMESTADPKIVVFFPATKLVAFYAALFVHGLDTFVWELHSRKSQPSRNRASKEFRESKRGILFTSDVSARGVDYPDVTHVIQFGTPESKEQYIHRLGRTGRAGKKETKDMLEAPLDPEIQEKMDAIKARIRSGDAILTTSAQQGYQAFLGYYLSNMKRLRINSKQVLVQYANEFAALTGLRDTPLLEKRLVGKMGLSGVNGVNIGSYKNPNGSTEKKGTRDHADGRKSPHKKERRS
eukprot:scaffold421244_cov58-Attheya_sp.AAC.3